jgi:predicted ATP-dependent endonuclease of OLD family
MHNSNARWLITTHSPYLLDLSGSNSSEIVYRTSRGTNGQSLVRGLKNVGQGQQALQFCSRSYYACSLLFANGVLFCEGETEVLFFHSFLSTDKSAEFNYTVIPVSGDKAHSNFRKLVQYLDIPYLWIFDGDHADGVKRKGTSNEDIVNSKTKFFEDFMSKKLYEKSSNEEFLAAFKTIAKNAVTIVLFHHYVDDCKSINFSKALPEVANYSELFVNLQKLGNLVNIWFLDECIENLTLHNHGKEKLKANYDNICSGLSDETIQLIRNKLARFSVIKK